MLRRFQGITLTKSGITRRFTTQPLNGVRAWVETTGGTDRRMTATRVVSGGILLGPLGAIFGGLAKKKADNRETTLHIEGPGFSWAVPVATNKISLFGGQQGYAKRKRWRAQRFAAKISSAGNATTAGNASHMTA